MIFVDTGAFLARYLAQDQYHIQARELWSGLLEKNERIATTNFVLDETFTLLARHAGYAFSAERAQHIYDSMILEIFRPFEEDEVKALELFKKYADQKVSFTDCISFVLMKKEKIKKAFTFDHHFQIAGFELYVS